MTADYNHLVLARQLAAGVAKASMSHAFANAIVAGKHDTSPAIQQIVKALQEGVKTDD